MQSFLVQSLLKSFLTAAIVLLSASVWAQEVHRPQDPDLLGRFSYGDPASAQPDAVRQVCISVSRDGDYRIVRSLNNGQAERLQGKMPKEQLQKLKTLVGAAEFRALTGNRGGLLRQPAESFGAEIPRGDDKAQRMQWLNAEGVGPFPDPVAKVVDWLKHFEPIEGKSFEYTDYPDVCPSSGLRLLQPSVAENGRP
jgi:hypothetical protein